MSSGDSSARSIVVDYPLQRSPRQVWRVLTEPALLGSWLMPNDIAPEVGHKFTFRAQPMPGWDGVVHCEVLAVDVERRLRYSWQGGSDTSFGGRLDTVVTWTLTPTDAGLTNLRLEHSGFSPHNDFAFENMGKGWRGKLAQRIEEVMTTVE